MTIQKRLLVMVQSKMQGSHDKTKANAIAEEIALRLGGKYKDYYLNMSEAQFNRFINKIVKG